MTTPIESRVVRLEKTTAQHADDIAELKRVDEVLMRRMDDVMVRLDDQHSDLREIKELAFRSTPPDVANRIQLHSLIWQVLLVAITGTGIVVGVMEWASRLH